MTLNGMLLVARLGLAGTFGMAGLAKLADRSGTAKSARDFGAPAAVAAPLAALLPFAELACAATLIPVGTAWWGATGVLAMLIVFTAAISISLIRGRTPECRCFGQLHSKPIGWITLMRNVVLGAAATLLVARGPDAIGPSVTALVDSASRLELVAWGLGVALVSLTAATLFLLVHLLKQNGRLLLRIETLEARGETAPAEPTPHGLPMNTPAPAFTLSGLDGRKLSLETLGARGKQVLLFFSEPGCGACATVLPEVAGWQREHANRLTVVPISTGDVPANRQKMTRHRLRDVLLQADREVAEAYQVNGTPAAVLVADGRIASPVAMGADAIRALVTTVTLSPALKVGERVQSLKLPDLNGRTIDLGTLGATSGHSTVLLFWNPSCGFCEQMLDDVRQWENERPAEAPELLIVSTGSIEANRQQALRSRVVLDHHFAAGQVFGSRGTPSAVVIDEQGRVASQVGVGAPAVLALAGAVPTTNAVRA